MKKIKQVKDHPIVVLFILSLFIMVIIRICLKEYFASVLIALFLLDYILLMVYANIYENKLGKEMNYNMDYQKHTRYGLKKFLTLSFIFQYIYLIEKNIDLISANFNNGELFTINLGIFSLILVIYSLIASPYNKMVESSKTTYEDYTKMLLGLEDEYSSIIEKDDIEFLDELAGSVYGLQREANFFIFLIRLNVLAFIISSIINITIYDDLKIIIGLLSIISYFFSLLYLSKAIIHIFKNGDKYFENKWSQDRKKIEKLYEDNLNKKS